MKQSHFFLSTGGCSRSGADQKSRPPRRWHQGAQHCAALTSEMGLLLEEDSKGSDKICDSRLELGGAAATAAPQNWSLLQEGSDKCCVTHQKREISTQEHGALSASLVMRRPCSKELLHSLRQRCTGTEDSETSNKLLVTKRRLPWCQREK